MLLDNGIYHTMDWRELNHGLFTALLIQQIGMSFVLALIILVAACTVIATLIMVVLEKKKEIALLKAIGAKNDAMLRIFLYQGGIIGLVGTALGILDRLALLPVPARLQLSARSEGLFHLAAAGVDAPARVRAPRGGRHRHLPRGHDLSGDVRRAAPPGGRPARRVRSR